MEVVREIFTCHHSLSKKQIALLIDASLIFARRAGVSVVDFRSSIKSNVAPRQR